MKLQDTEIEKIKNWIRTLQKSLTLETEAEFINILGKEKYFNDFLYESLKTLSNFKLSEEYIHHLKKFSHKYQEYNQLDLNQRKRVVIDTRKILFKLSRNLESPQPNKTLSNKLMSVNSDIEIIHGVGKVIKDNLNQLGLFNINDLLKYFPRTYLDYTNKEKIINLRPDNIYTCSAYIKKFYIYKSKKNNNLSIMNIIVFDETSSIKITKFFLGRRFRSYSFFSIQKEKFKPGLKVAISGKVKSSEYGRAFVDPQIEILNDNNSINFSGKILPIYSLSESISNFTFIKTLKKVLPFVSDYQDLLTKNQLEKLSLFSLSEALKNIHFPSSQLSLIESKKRLLFDELLLLQIKFLLKKNKRNKLLVSSNFYLKRTLLDKYLNSLPFKLTKSQNNVLEEIKIDLSGQNPMSRLLQGDVGSGKTIIAIASLLYIVERGNQGAFMVPTEVLAEQHYQNLLNNLNSMFVNVELLTGNTSQKKRKEIFRNLANGQINILVGTHALFEEKVIFNSLGIVIIDEQHRFGVSQRNRLLKKGENAHLLSMTATPIPRTLALSIYGDLDVSQITELPPGRKPIKTNIVSEKKLKDLYVKVESEIIKGKQVYVVLPLIEESEKLNLNSANKVFEYLSKEVFQKYNIGLLHGKLNSSEKNQIIELFLKNKINILVSTTVIEVGIDVPNASIMIIYNSERFGLSQLHQLRGRVGRDSYESHCYLVTNENNITTNKRLEVLKKSNDGFFIAEKDLELRGPGQILGYKQSGLPDFVLDNLPNNKILIDKAREEAINILEEDPNLDKNIIIKKALNDNLNNKYTHDFLN